MRSRSAIFDISLDAWEGEGPPIRFPNREIRKMLSLANAGRNDVFYDLGSGWAQNLIIALTEYDVKKAVGIENDRERYDRSLRRLRKWKIAQNRWNLICEPFEKVLLGRAKKSDPSGFSRV